MKNTYIQEFKEINGEVYLLSTEFANSNMQYTTYYCFAKILVSPATCATYFYWVGIHSH